MKLTFPELSLVLLVGPSGCGKSTFAQKHFLRTEVLSSDFFRAMVCDDESNQAASRDAFDLLHLVVARRLARKRFTVIDATNLHADARKPLLELARKYHYLTGAIVFDVPEEVCQRLNIGRPSRIVPERVITNHVQLLRKNMAALQREGLTKLYTLTSLDDIAAAAIERVPLWVDKRHEHGPFDIIGDVHGCLDELLALLVALGYHSNPATPTVIEPPPGRKAIFVGDLGDRGPDTPGVYRLVMDLVQRGHAMSVMGNHDFKLSRKLRGNEVKLTHGLAETMEQFAAAGPELTEQVRNFLDSVLSHYVLDEGKLVVAHAGLREDMQGRASGKVRSFAMYGDTTGEMDDLGLPVRLDWAADYRGEALVVYGHTPVAYPAWKNNTVNIDTGCVFGGKLSALRYPEKEVVAVPSLKQYCDPVRPFLAGPGGEITPLPQQVADDLLDLDDVAGKRRVETNLMGAITVPEANAAAALEVMSRFAANPKWLIYLPPTMAPCETSQAPGLLEHPAEALAYFRNTKQERVVCQEKHMGSRAIVLICRDEAAAARAFGVTGEGLGAVLTRTGRRFFDAGPLEAEFLTRLRDAVTQARLWDDLATDWLCLDAELLPWSAKAQELLRTQYAAVGAAGRAALSATTEQISPVAGFVPELPALLTRYRERAVAVDQFVAAYRRYCWPVKSVTDLKLAPFHLMASEGAVHVDKPHSWHLEKLGALVRADSAILRLTAHRVVELNDPGSVAAGVTWWEELTANGGEGMVVKPLDFVARTGRGMVQPALKCRGPEYLRLIYGPEYRAPEHLDRLRQRGLAAKRSLALREFALGIEGLERFVRREPLRRVHECSFAVLALESEPVDPRL